MNVRHRLTAGAVITVACAGIIDLSTPAADRGGKDAEFTLSLGAVSVAWPADALAVTSRLRHLADVACRAASTARLVERARCGG